jgi:hypothetical protein
MANEITEALLESNGGRVGQVLSALVLERLYDPSDLRALMQFVPWAAQGSDTMRVTLDAVPGSYSAASTEISGGQSNSAYTTSKFDLTVARYVRQYQATDLFAIGGPPVTLASIAQKLSIGVGLTITDLLTALFANVASSVGTSGQNLSADNIYSAMFQLNSSNVPRAAGSRWACVLHPVQINDLVTSLRSEVGAMQYQSATADMLAVKGPGFHGTWNGVDFFQSDSVATANAAEDRDGCMFESGAFAYSLASIRALPGQQMIDPDDLIVDADIFMVERSRDATNGMTTLIGNFYPAVVEKEDLRACRVVTDA